MTNSEINPFRIDVPQADLDDLADRLARVRWADELPASELAALPAEGPVQPGWQYGVPVDFVRRLVELWRTEYDWRAWEAKLNAYPQFTTEIDGQNIHFLHVRSPRPDATPLILTHGWPNSVVEYLDLIEPLTNPGADDPAFHLVIPSLPGFGFSGPTHERGWNRHRTARAWAELMRRLGYERYGAHGNDAGAFVSPEVGRIDPEHVIGVHVTQLFSFPSGDPAEFAGMTEQELEYLRFLQAFNDNMTGYAKLQETAPQNLAHALADSPTGQLAWSAQLLAGTPAEHLLTNATIYWLTNTAASAARFYYEDNHVEHPTTPTTTPTGLASFAYDFTPLRRFAERDHANIVSWNEFDKGGHWATQDAPELLVADLRQFFKALNTARG
ncbi:epoxide hydrolase family protein [Labedaea rhizosphaerae]|uniref:Pimeloyl-ACP methyl ester carboxylesterase n=1 Tax=Labedaea rhizosphaerae TaxID=598644 RepID=A0A4R6S5H6_LABRH|nr:epoxide hydrolase family protein [Labedaea rhizosphaerae]TDP94006.1 pimeloyl-ACP methyl ester carboxylesterase [Labedaea rhizosphaerae]